MWILLGVVVGVTAALTRVAIESIADTIYAERQLKVLQAITPKLMEDMMKVAMGKDVPKP